jgi:hypothetical protein
MALEAVDALWALAVFGAAVDTVRAPIASTEAITAGAIFLKQFVIFVPRLVF